MYNGIATGIAAAKAADPANSYDSYDIERKCQEALLRFYQRQTDRLLGKRHERQGVLGARFSQTRSGR